MNLFDKIVNSALQNQKELVPLRMAVEKELLHHDILREMSNGGLLQSLTFFGGTCLRMCYGSNRLSEDLDFTGGFDFTKNDLANLKELLTDNLKKKYDLQISVSEPQRERGNVDTWKMRVITRPGQSSLPQQRIHIDICAIPSYDRQPMVLRNHYNVEMGTSGLIIQAQSLSEIFADKIVALGLRPNRIKNRDLWDISWLVQKNIFLPVETVLQKIDDHNTSRKHFKELLQMRLTAMRYEPGVRRDFVHELRRFLPPNIVKSTVENEDFWQYLTNTIEHECKQIPIQ